MSPFLPATILAAAFLLSAGPASASSVQFQTEIVAMNLQGSASMPLGGAGFTPAATTILATESPGETSLVTTSIAYAVDSRYSLKVLGLTIDIPETVSFEVTQTANLYYRLDLTSTEFGPGLSSPISIVPSSPLQVITSIAAGLSLDFSGFDGTPASLGYTEAFGPTSTTVSGNVVTHDLGTDYNNDNVSDVLTLNLQEFAVTDMTVGGVSIGGITFDESGNLDPTGLDLKAFLPPVDLTQSGLSFESGSLVFTGSINPDIPPITLSGSFATTVVPLPAAGILLAPAMLLLGWSARKRG